MRASSLFFPTLKESPSEAELISHQYMLRAGLIRKLASGLYTWLPLGLRILNKIEAIVREEMVKINAQELLMPIVQPGSLWEETGRWEEYGPTLLTMQDRNNRAFCFGPTHEEVVTDLVRNEVQSYKQLPLCFFQIQTKFRDEIRPRFGVMRAREFLMKDAYSFHENKDCLEKTYASMFQAYEAIFTRLGLSFKPVLADTGNIGGEISHEFQVLANAGEDIIAYSDEGHYAANIERAETLKSKESLAAPLQDLSTTTTPNITSVPAQAKHMNLPVEKILKTLLVRGSDEQHPVVALLVRGDHQLNPLKAQKLPGIQSPLVFIPEQELAQMMGCNAGFVGPKNLNIPVFADYAVGQMSDFSCGANKTDHHFIGFNWLRDAPMPKLVDLRFVEQGDPSPCGQGRLQFCHGIEVGHIFQLGDKYTQSMQAFVLNEKGKSFSPLMGCYGIGVSRILAAAIEQHYDERGILWPKAMAPFQVALVSLGAEKDEQVKQKADSLYHKLQNLGIETLYDDRALRPGQKFADMELLGIPHRIVISKKMIDNQAIEYKARHSELAEIIKESQSDDFLRAKIMV